jgi:phage terminase large subunit-like protein
VGSNGNGRRKLAVWDHYVDGVLGDAIPACEMIKKACERHRKDLERSATTDWPWHLDLAKAQRVIDFFSLLQLTKGLPYPGKKFRPEPWQQFLLASLFGWVHKKTRLRRFMKGHIMIPRKCGKSPLMAGIGLYGLTADDEMGSEVYSAATKRDQARIIWDFAVEFRRHSGDLAERVAKSFNALYVAETGSKFQALSSDEEGLDGLNVHFGLVDEYQRHKTSVVYDRIASAISARRQLLVLSIATAGTDQESPCYIERDYALHVLMGDFEDDRYFAFLAEADIPEKGELDWEDEEVWKKCNPNLGVSKSWEYMRMAAKAARNEPRKLNAFKQLDLNVWTQQEYVYIPMHRWRQCAGEVTRTEEATGEVKLVNPRDREAVEDAMLAQWRLPFGGLDLSSKDDLTALVNLFPPTQADPHWIVTCRFWVPEDAVERRSRNDRVPYDLWVEQKLIQATPGEVVDYDFVEKEIAQLHAKLHYQALGFDPWNALQLSTHMRGYGVPMVEVRQGYASLTDPTKELLAWVLSQKVFHLNDPVLNWNTSNMAVTEDPAGNVKPDKARARERMDGTAALINAIHLALLRPTSIYSQRGLFTI